MAKFKFQKSEIDVEIEDLVFKVEVDDSLRKKAVELGIKAVELSQQAPNQEDQEKAVEEIINFCAESIDELLGQGAYSKIFEGRKPNYTEHVDVWTFIVTEIAQGAQNYNSNIVQKYDPNRIARKKK